MTIDNGTHIALENLADKVYWSINTPFEEALKDIGKLFAKFYPDKDRKSILLWKNLDALNLANPFIKIVGCTDHPVYTQRLIKGAGVIKNEYELQKFLKESSTEPPDAVVFLDVVAGTGGTAKRVYDIVKSHLPAPRFYFYCVFGSTGLRKRIQKWLSERQFFLIREYPMMNEDIDPPRLEWFVMSDLGDRYLLRSAGGMLIETPLKDELRINTQRLQKFHEERLVEHTFSGTLHDARIIDRMGDMAIVGGTLFLLQREGHQHTYRTKGKVFEHLEFYRLQAILKMVKIARAENSNIGEYIGEIKKDRKGILKSQKVQDVLSWFKQYGYVSEDSTKDIWKFNSNFMVYFSEAIHPTLEDYNWYKAMENSAYDILTGSLCDGL